MAANCATAMGIQNVRIIDKRNSKIFTGQADGLQCRTLEVFQSFGMAEDIWKSSNHMIEICFWNPIEGKLQRTGRIPDTIPNISRWQQVVLHQGRIERLYLNNIQRNSNGKVHVDRAILPEKFNIDLSNVESNEDDVYPISIQVKQLSEEEATPSQMGKSAPNGLFRSALSPDDTPELLQKDAVAGSREVIHAKYVIGCDGAHSWTRKQMGFEMLGEQTDYIWGVLDAIPITDFPDIRMRCAIHSESSGSVMVIPREDGLVRFYIQISETNKSVDRNNITWQMILKSAQTILHPFTLDIAEKDLNWWTAYQIGQRVATGFSLYDRCFIAGDACHTHSPKAGQGMNVSMMDTYNLTWKIAKVLLGQSPRSILTTYQSERRKVAQELIDFDHKFSRLFSGKPKAAEDAANEAGVSLSEFKDVFAKGNKFASGTAVEYGPSLLIGRRGNVEKEGDDTTTNSNTTSSVVLEPGAISKPKLSREDCGESRIIVGARFNTAQVVCVSDARPWELIDWLPSDGRWRVILFSGDILNPTQRSKIDKVASYLQDKLLPRYTPVDHDVDSVIDVLTVSSTPRTACELTEYPEILRPMTTRWHQPGTGKNSSSKAMSRDYWKIFCDDDSYHSGHGHAYEKYGISSEGAIVVIRPDGYVSLLVELQDTSSLDSFFAKCMLPASHHKTGRGEASKAASVAHTNNFPTVKNTGNGDVAVAL